MTTPEEYGTAFGEGFVKMFQDPDARGSNFSWDEAPDIAAGCAWQCYFTAVPDGNPTREEKDRAAAAAKKVVSEYVEKLP